MGYLDIHWLILVHDPYFFLGGGVVYIIFIHFQAHPYQNISKPIHGGSVPCFFLWRYPSSKEHPPLESRMIVKHYPWTEFSTLQIHNPKQSVHAAKSQHQTATDKTCSPHVASNLLWNEQDIVCWGQLLTWLVKTGICSSGILTKTE